MNRGGKTDIPTDKREIEKDYGSPIEEQRLGTKLETQADATAGSKANR